MRKTAILLLLAMSTMVACNLLAPNKQQENAPAENQPAESTQTMQQPEATTPAKPKTETATKTEEAAPAVPEKVPKAGLGVIFLTDMKEGTLRVKIDGERAYESAFQRGSSFTDKELRIEKELTFPSGQHELRFAVLDGSGKRVAMKEYKMVFDPKTHHAVKISVLGDKMEMTLEMIE
jgi:glucose/arabinose dehydrogenase